MVKIYIFLLFENKLGICYTSKHITLECSKFNGLRSILRNPISMEQALREKSKSWKVQR